MPDVGFYPLTSCLLQASEAQTRLAVSKLHLFQDALNPSPSNVLADYTANEADFTGYTAGGNTITAFLDPIYSPVGGAQLQSPTSLFAVGASPTVTNNIKGWYLVNAAGDLEATGVYENAIPMAVAGQGIPVDVVLRFGTGQ